MHREPRPDHRSYVARAEAGETLVNPAAWWRSAFIFEAGSVTTREAARAARLISFVSKGRCWLSYDEAIVVVRRAHAACSMNNVRACKAADLEIYFDGQRIHPVAVTLEFLDNMSEARQHMRHAASYPTAPTVAPVRDERQKRAAELVQVKKENESLRASEARAQATCRKAWLQADDLRRALAKALDDPKVPAREESRELRAQKAEIARLSAALKRAESDAAAWTKAAHPRGIADMIARTQRAESRADEAESRLAAVKIAAEQNLKEADARIAGVRSVRDNAVAKVEELVHVVDTQRARLASFRGLLEKLELVLRNNFAPEIAARIREALKA
jgi:hypothetical protein